MVDRNRNRAKGNMSTAQLTRLGGNLEQATVHYVIFWEWWRGGCKPGDLQIMEFMVE